MVSPPYWFGGEFVNITYDSITSCMGYDPVSYMLLLKRDFTDTGAEYLQIINHSENNPVEYFIAGTQDVETHDKQWCSGMYTVKCSPSVYYENAPIYYLIKPEVKYTKNLSRNSFDCRDILYFEGNRCGDLILDKAWDINDIAKLYKAEYNRSKDTILYVDEHSRTGYGRMIEAINSTKWRDLRLYNSKFYGIIPPKGKLIGDERIWILATEYFFEEYFIYAKL